MIDQSTEHSNTDLIRELGHVEFQTRKLEAAVVEAEVHKLEAAKAISN